MRTQAQVNEYIKTVSCGLLEHIDAHRTNKGAMYVHASTTGRSATDLVLDVDGQHVLCQKTVFITVDSWYWVNKITQTTAGSLTEVTIACSAILPEPGRISLDLLDFDFPVPSVRNMVIWWRDRPCLTLTQSGGLGDPSVSNANNLAHVRIRGHWKEFHEFLLGHDIQIREHNEN